MPPRGSVPLAVVCIWFSKVVFGYFGSIALGLLTGLVTAIIKPEFVETIRNLFR